ncbi:MAG: ribose-5-phosphate isomerase RpiA [Bacteroidia bacterium]|nr:ribose-5-phosphate isomerase RpiA [Bacteroidia bacterium]
MNKIKQQLGKEAALLVQSDTTIGIGSGSTVFFFIEALAQRVASGLKCLSVPTSEQSRLLAHQNGIATVTLNDVDEIVLTIDGADEIDPQLQLIKGGGGALLQEKMVAAASKQLIIIADNSKLVSQLGSFPLPIEVVPYGWKQVQHYIQKMYSIRCELRIKNNETYITDHRHYILDCHFQRITDLVNLNNELHQIPGLIETGLFINMADMAIIGYPDGTIKQFNRR